MEDICVPPDWERLKPQTLTGTVLAIGGVDAGKSVFIRWLAGRLDEPGAGSAPRPFAGPSVASVVRTPGEPGFGTPACPGARTVAWIDGDVGQPALGPPACQHLALLGGSGHGAAQASQTPPGDAVGQDGERPLFPPVPVASFFVGAVSPVGRLLPTLVGVKRLQERALAAGADATLVDTSGFVAERAGGAALKEWVVEVLRPSLVIALVRGAELDRLLAPLARDRRVRLEVLPVCEAVRRRSPEKRAERRARQFRQAFATPARLDVRLDDLAVWGLDAAVKLSLGALLGDDGFVLALCLLLERRGADFSLLASRAVDPTQVAALRFGALRLDPATGLPPSP